MKQKLILLTIFLTAFSAFSQTQYLTWATNADNTINITGYQSTPISLTIPDTIDDLPVTSLEVYAFGSCYSLTSIAIGSNVTTIGGDAFYECNNLTEIAVNEGNTLYSSLDGVLFNKDQTVISVYPGGKTGSYTIPNSVTSIGYSAFQTCPGLTGITIPENVTTMGDWAFYECPGLTSVTIPNSVTAMGENAFCNCTGLTSITIDGTIGNSAFYNCNNLIDVTIGSGTTTIGDWAFYRCGLTSITIPGSVTSVGGSAFYQCTNLIDVTIDSGTIGGYAFGYCTSLTHVEIGSSVTTMEDYAFSDCTSLIDVTISDGLTCINRGTFAYTGLIGITIPSSVTNIGEYAFNHCTQLTGIYFLGNAPGYGDRVFNYDEYTTVYRLPEAADWPMVPDLWAGRPTALWFSYLLAGNGGIGGTVSPASTNVPSGDSVNFVITASNFYRIATLTTNGTAVVGMSFGNNSTTTNFIWSNVQTSGVLAATFTAQVTTEAPVDVPYEWLAKYGLTNYNTDADLDQDMDGLKAWQEYIAGTDPTNTTSCFKATQNARNIINWSAVSGRVYSVCWSTNLVKGLQPLETNILYPQGSYTNATPDPRVNYYQIKVRMQ
ncbi:MAG: leucine-rich repeat domain-containing protein [Kiritimatiellales bacterium]